MDSESGNRITVESDGVHLVGNIPFGETYDLSIDSISEGLTCAIENGFGTLPIDGTNVAVTCTTLFYDLSVNINGGLINTIELSTGDTFTSDGTYSLGSRLLGEEYSITIASQPEVMHSYL